MVVKSNKFVIFMMSIFEIYASKEKAVYPKSDFINDCWLLLKEAEKSEEWILAGEKAPSREVVVNILTGRTVLTNPLWKKVWIKGFGFKDAKELMGM